MSAGRRASHLFDVAWDGGELLVRHLHNTISDYAHLLQWLTTPAVLEWYEGRDRDFDLATILAEYGPGGEHERDGIIPAIIELDGEPIGYVQLDELDDPADAAALDLDDGRDIWSLDLSLGRPDLFGRGIGRAVGRSAAEHLLRDRDAREVVILPYVDNARAIAAYRAAGFEGDHVVREHELHEGIMRDALRLHYRATDGE
jgi:aminoglycoside 6'-N-acetyltransferase